MDTALSSILEPVTDLFNNTLLSTESSASFSFVTFLFIIVLVDIALVATLGSVTHLSAKFLVCKTTLSFISIYTL